MDDVSRPASNPSQVRANGGSHSTTAGDDELAGSKSSAITTAVAVDAALPAPKEAAPNLRNSTTVRACLACRQMKMKCEGAANPPCVKCRKAGRQCVPQIPNGQGPLTQQAFLPPTQSVMLQQQQQPLPSPSASSYYDRRSVSQDFQLPPFGKHFGSPLPAPPRPLRDGRPDLPSIFSTTPIEFVAGSGSGSPTSHATNAHKRRRLNVLDDFDSTISSVMPVPIQDLKDMLQMFRERILSNLPVLRPDDFRDMDGMIRTQLPLVYCACYITARHLPDGKVTRDLLLPEVLRVIRGISSTSAGDERSSLSILQALILLYANSARTTPPSEAFEILKDGELQYWPLKFRLEMYAMHLSLHNSVQQLRLELKRDQVTHITDSISYRKYVFWLQLFLMSHYYSIICGTPPSIRVDSTIRLAPSLLGPICQHPDNRILGEVELCLIWEQASLSHPQLAEWWCLPDQSELDDESTEAILVDASRRIDLWYDRWKDYMPASDNHGIILDYHGRFTRFYISSCAVRCLKQRQGLTQLQQQQIRRATLCANQVLELLVNMRPIQKDRLRYLPATSSTMVAFCGHFMLSTCQAFTSSVYNIQESLENVAKIAQLMIDLALDPEHKAFAQGTFLLRRAEAVRGALMSQRITPQRSDNATEIGGAPAQWEILPEQQQNFDFGQELAGLEPFWDFSLLYNGTL